MKLTMHVCLWYSLITVLILFTCLSAGGLQPRAKVGGRIVPFTWHAGVALAVVASLAVTHVASLLGGAHSYVSKKVSLSYAYAKMSPVSMPGAHDASLMLLWYSVQIACGLGMYFFSGGIAHTDAFARKSGRIIYLIGFLQRSFAAPLLVLISNSVFLDSRPVLVRRSWASMLAAFTSVWAAWLMEVAPLSGVRITMLLLSLAGSLFVALDQFYVANEEKAANCHGIKLGLLISLRFCDFVYAAVWLVGRAGIISASLEQLIFTYGDTGVKVFTGAFLVAIRSRENALEMRRWCEAANEGARLLCKVPAFTLSLSGSILEWNACIAKLTGLEMVQVQGKRLVDFMPDDSKQEFVKQFVRKLAEYQLATADLPEDGCKTLPLSITKDSNGSAENSVRRFAVSLLPKRNSGGQLEGFIVVGQGMSSNDEKKMDKEQRNILVNMLSQEVRCPLHGIVGLTAALIKNPELQPQHRNLEMIKGCSARLLDMMNNVIDLAESERRSNANLEETSRPKTPVNLPAIVDEAITMIGNSVDRLNKPMLKPGVSIRNDSIGLRVPLVKGDAVKCTHLLYNLLDNACKFTDKGTITVKFRHLRQEGLLEVDVVDTGRGISEESQEHMFQAFQTDSSVDSKRLQGVGLGLAACKEIVELHKGSLRVTSRVGQGSTFTLSLPCLDDSSSVEVFGENVAAEPPEAKAIQESVGKQSPYSSESGMADVVKGRPFILSVDDDEVNQEVIKAALGDVCDVSCTMCGQETLNFFDSLVRNKREFPQLVLLDIQMPGMSGFEVCEQIRTRYNALSGGNMPVTMLSAKAPSEMACLQSFDSGCTDFIAKPFNPEILRRKVIAALQLQESGVRLASTGLLTSEAFKHVKTHEEKEKKARNQVQAVEAELQSAKEQVTMADSKIKSLELKLASITSTSKAQEEKMNTTAEERDKLLQRVKSLEADQAKAKAIQTTAASSVQPAAVDMDAKHHGQLKRSFATIDGIDASFVITLLASRLASCVNTAKQCQHLLNGGVSFSSPQVVDSHVTTLVDYESKQARLQLKQMTALTKLAVSELAMLVQVGSNIGGIVQLMSDLGYGYSDDY